MYKGIPRPYKQPKHFGYLKPPFWVPEMFGVIEVDGGWLNDIPPHLLPIKRKSWVPMGEYPRYLPTYTTYIWVI